ncbi:MAG: glycosyltransferase [Oscillospiraceae bacterium]|nr:glycosyltransferase [Oscillospiraceae bacterium]
MKILYTASTDGHLRAFHRPYLAALAQRGHAVTAAAAGDGRGLPEGVRFLPVPFSKGMFSPVNLYCAAYLAALLRRERFALVLTHTSLAAFFTRLAVIAAGRPRPRVVNTVHGYLFSDAVPGPRRSLLLAAEKLCAAVTDDILVMNEEDRRIAEAHRLCRGCVFFTRGMGVPRMAPPEVSRSEARRRLGVAEDAFVLLYAAEFSPRKNQREMLTALARLPEDVRLLLPGDGALRERCRRQAAALGVAGRVLFPGQVNDMRPYRQCADLCVSSSRSEGLPFHAVEAMADGLPCLLSAVKGHVDLLSHGHAGLLYPPGNIDALCRAVTALRSDPALRASLGAKAARRAEEYALDAVMEPILRLYEGR